MKRVMVILGTRPEGIKMAPVIKELKNIQSSLKSRFVQRANIEKCWDRFSIFWNRVRLYS